MNPYSASFFKSLRDSARSSARFVVPLVLSWIDAKSVVDVGCGSGTWLSVIREHGIDDILGIDGDYVCPESLEIPADCFLTCDLSLPLRLPRRFDLAVSLEVAEHLPAQSAETFIESLARLAPVVVFSAAAPYQGGTHHLNEQWPAYWAERFAVHGYFPVDCLRRQLWSQKDVAWWYAQNTFLYVTEATLHSNRRLFEEHAACSVALPLVHPHRYLEWIEWGLAQMQRADQSSHAPADNNSA
jgi:SAM-dependent methyltransferase